MMSQHRRAAINAEVNRLTSRAYANAKTLLQKHETELQKLAEELMREETLTGESLIWTLGVSNHSLISELYKPSPSLPRP